MKIYDRKETNREKIEHYRIKLRDLVKEKTREKRKIHNNKEKQDLLKIKKRKNEE